ncbi:hypothetical protein ACTHSJ_05360 [Paenibacillus cellulositrophicus]|uniref:hypothetical protein n=1 Tax=Paenibacillus cellulositrophicus TaxID=562959 RepID=UPI003F8131B2
MKWENTIYLSRIREFIVQQSDRKNLTLMVQSKLKKIKGERVSKESVANSINNFTNGASPTGEYIEAYLQVIDDLLEGRGSLEILLRGKYNQDKEIELRELLMTITKGKSFPIEFKQYLDKPSIIFELTEVFYKLIFICFIGQKDPELNLTRFRVFLEIFTNKNGGNS